MRRRRFARTWQELDGYVSEDRGEVWTNRTFASMPIDIHPNDLYLRVNPDGPYSQAWQGVQKVNPIADVGTGFADILSPFRTRRAKLPTIQQWNPTSHSIGAGPALIQAQQEEQQYIAAGGSPGLLAVIVDRLRGR